jgi:hypothetical protein
MHQYWLVAQLEEYGTFNPWVVGSIPARPTAGVVEKRYFEFIGRRFDSCSRKG